MNKVRRPKLINAQDMAKQYPESFYAPSEEKLLKVSIGDNVKICNNYERFWCPVESIDIKKITFKTRVDNFLVLTNYEVGDYITVGFDHVYDISKN
jgi:hypothetical protein